ncbi:MAG: aldo/keto reductase [Hyphomicrobiales bacterium]
MFDSADVYSGGLAEEILGQAIKGKRDRLLISIKTTFPSGAGPNDFGSSRQRLLEGCSKADRLEHHHRRAQRGAAHPEYRRHRLEADAATDCRARPGERRAARISGLAPARLPDAERTRLIDGRKAHLKSILAPSQVTGLRR